MPQSTLGLYVSIPFCRAKCSFCNFASGVFGGTEQHARYVDRLCEEIHRSPTLAADHAYLLPNRVDTVYFGGGTPSTLLPEHLRQIFGALRSEFHIEAGAEITVECAPAHIDSAFLSAMVEAGVNRVSLGVQSFVDAESAAVGRTHTRQATLADIARLRRAGIVNVNVDLIAGLPHQTTSSWAESLSVLADADVDHASLYMLEVDEDSRLGRELLDGGVRYSAGLTPSDDTVAGMYESGCGCLERIGLAQYEISNFARRGAESRHNQRYWQRQPYLGFGLDAHSMLHTTPQAHAGPAVRFGNTDDLMQYLSRPQPHQPSIVSAAEALEEAWFLGLRMNRGVSLSALRAEFGTDAVAGFARTLSELANDGLLAAMGKHVTLTQRGRMLSNEVFARFLAAAESRELALSS